jgi:succinoglycan biosynthesis protein ExoW
MATISVIIPYFQHQAGILRKSLNSVFEQCLPADWLLDVIIVDDASPSPPELEFADTPPAPIPVRIIKKANGGPGAARNTGLDVIPAQADFIAFLDSDDIWAPDHLQRAITTLGADADFYFSDQEITGLTEHRTHFQALRLQSGIPEFRRCGLPKNIAVRRFEQPIISPREPEGSYVFHEKEGLTSLIRSFLPHLSVTVIRARYLAHIRFHTELRHSGEDYLYFLMLANAARKVCYSNHVGAIRGRGVSVFHDAISWENPKSFAIVLDALRCFLLARTSLDLNAAQRELLDRRISFRRLELIARSLSDVRRLKLPAVHLVFRADPGLVIRSPLLVAQALWRKTRGKPIPDHLRASELP